MAAGVYIHIPFCKSRCSYCDFATDIYRDASWVERYVDALCVEIGSWRPSEGGTQNANTIYFGGGTPSLLTPRQVEKILDSVASTFEISNLKELTMEMNPATVTLETLAEYRSRGVNRASFGVQTFNDRALKLLARGHNADDARQTFRMLRAVGFDNVSFDLIAGLPGQTLDVWKANLDEALEMQPEHLSLYLLEIHEGTPLADQVNSGRRARPDDDLAAEMYELMLDRLSSAGYEQYEISNFAKPGFESRHNSRYWRLEPVFGFGVSAHSFNGTERYANERDTAQYVEMIERFGSAEVSRESINHASEYLYLGLRMERGIDLDEHKQIFGNDIFIRYNGKLDELIELGLIDLSADRMRLTRKGKLFSNEVFAVFV